MIRDGLSSVQRTQMGESFTTRGGSTLLKVSMVKSVLPWRARTLMEISTAFYRYSGLAASL